MVASRNVISLRDIKTDFRSGLFSGFGVVGLCSGGFIGGAFSQEDGARAADLSAPPPATGLGLRWADDNSLPAIIGFEFLG